MQNSLEITWIKHANKFIFWTQVNHVKVIICILCCTVCNCACCLKSFRLTSSNTESYFSINCHPHFKDMCSTKHCLNLWYQMEMGRDFENPRGMRKRSSAINSDLLLQLWIPWPGGDCSTHWSGGGRNGMLKDTQALSCKQITVSGTKMTV